MKYIKIYEDYLDDKPKLNTSRNGSNNLINEIDIIKGDLTYKEFIDKILKTLGYKAKSLIAYGSSGAAIELENDLVLKLTSDEQEIINSYKLLNVNSEYLVNIKYVGKLDNPLIVGVIIMEKLNPLNISDKNILGRILIDNYTRSPVTMRADIIAKTKAKKYNISKELLDNILNILSEMSKYNMTSQDLHVLNLAMSENGIIKAFDFGAHTFYKKSVLDEIPKINI